MRALSRGYSAEVDAVEEADWYRLLERFDDANIYQTWAYALVRSGRQNISHLVLKHEARIVAIAQCRIEKLPGIGAGIAYVLWGPVWQSSGARLEAEVFRQAIRALRQEYAGRRGLFVRIYPALFEDESAELLSILEEEGFRRGGAQRAGSKHLDGSYPFAGRNSKGTSSALAARIEGCGKAECRNL